MANKTELFNLLKGEFKQTEGFGKLFLIALFFNIPVDGFIPYFSQVVTVIILSIFLKKYLLQIKNNTHKEDNSNLPTVHGSKIIIGLTIFTMTVQVVWVPYITQLVTLVLLGLLYACFSVYVKDKE